MDCATYPSASPFGELLEEVEREAVRAHGSIPPRAASAGSSLSGRLPELSFETLAGRDAAALAEGRRRLTLPVSIAVHAVGIGAVILVPLLMSQSPPEVAGGVRAFLVEPMVAPPPPPPPPAPRSATSAKVTPAAPAPEAGKLVAPVEVPAAVRPEMSDLGLPGGIEGGVLGGVEGGIPGGVVGGIVGGLPEKLPPAPAVKPVRVGGFVREPRRTRYIAPTYPSVAAQAHLQGTVIIEATINAQGSVVDAKVLRGLPMLNEAALEAVRQWGYVPTLLNGEPTPIMMVVRVNFRLGNGA